MKTIRFIVRGGRLEPLEPVELVEGSEVNVTVPIESTLSTGTALLARVRQAPDIDPSIVDELDRTIESGELPVQRGGRFDDFVD